MLRISGGSLSRIPPTVVVDAVAPEDDDVCCFLFELCRLVADDVFLDTVPFEDEIVRCQMRELRSVVDMITSEDGFICCWILELRRVVSTLAAGTGAIIESC